MNKLNTKQLKAAKTNILPSDGFVDNVMQKIEEPTTRRFGWLITASALGVLTLGLVGVSAFVNRDNTVTAVENEIAEIESILAELESGFADSELDEVAE